jgi:hypothetical protein
VSGEWERDCAPNSPLADCELVSTAVTTTSTHSRIHDICELGTKHKAEARSQVIRKICLSIQSFQKNIVIFEPGR